LRFGQGAWLSHAAEARRLDLPLRQRRREKGNTEKFMPSVLVGAIFIPGTWFSYLLVRWVLTHFEMNLDDKVALSFLTALAYLIGHIVVAMNLGRSRRLSTHEVSEPTERPDARR
jgi:hypothetical protein